MNQTKSSKKRQETDQADKPECSWSSFDMKLKKYLTYFYLYWRDKHDFLKSDIFILRVTASHTGWDPHLTTTWFYSVVTTWTVIQYIYFFHYSLHCPCGVHTYQQCEVKIQFYVVIISLCLSYWAVLASSSWLRAEIPAVLLVASLLHTRECFGGFIALFMWQPCCLPLLCPCDLAEPVFQFPVLL